MAIIVTCPNCKHELEALDEHAGMKASCANCNAEFLIPGEIKASHDVMISYSTKDKSVADAACFVLERNGIRCWIAPRDITPGKEWGEAIIDAIGEARVILLIFSSSSDQSQQVQREVERAVAKAKPIIPFRIENVPPTKSMEYFLSNTHWLDAFTGDLEKHLDMMARKIQAILQAEAPKETEGLHPTDGTIHGKEMSTSVFSRAIACFSAIIMGMLLCSFIIYYFRSIPSKTMDPIDTKNANTVQKLITPSKVPDGFEMLKAPSPDSDGWATEIRHKDTGIEMVYVTPGEFMMGSPSNEKKRDEDELQHRVKLTRAFYIGKYEITQGQCEKVTGMNPSYFKNVGKDAPMENVSWYECQKFCQMAGKQFRLPTEAEWEYACRGGNKSKGFIYSGSNNTDEMGWHHWLSGNTTHQVGQKKPNELGIYDMSGNVWEWCADRTGDYPKATVTDPIVISSEVSAYVCRGGGWNYDTWDCRSANRSSFYFERGNMIGLRLSMDIPSTESNQTSAINTSSAIPNSSSQAEKELPPTPIVGRDWKIPGIGMEFVWIRALNCWVGKYEVTNREYRMFKSGHNSKEYKGISLGISLNGDRQPAVRLDHKDVSRYAEWLTEREDEAGRLPFGYDYRPPTENEWTIFCQCGDNRKYPWGNEMPPRFGNYYGQECDNGKKIEGYNDGFPVSCPVEKSGKNDWGLYGVGGNVWECTITINGPSKAIKYRGGSWYNDSSYSLLSSYSTEGGLLVSEQCEYGFRLLLAPR